MSFHHERQIDQHRPLEPLQMHLHGQYYQVAPPTHREADSHDVCAGRPGRDICRVELRSSVGLLRLVEDMPCGVVAG